MKGPRNMTSSTRDIIQAIDVQVSSARDYHSIITCSIVLGHHQLRPNM